MSQDPVQPDVGILPDDEDLAAMAEGRLPESRREAVLARLAEDSGYYELYAELLWFAEEEGAEAAEEIIAGQAAADVLSFPRAESPASAGTGQADLAMDSKLVARPTWRRWAPWAGLAAAAVLVAVIGGQIFFRPPSLESLTADLKASKEHLISPAGGVPRGSGDGPLSLDRKDSFKLGTLLIDVVVAEGMAGELDGRDPPGDISRLLHNSLLDDTWTDCQSHTVECGAAFVEGKLIDQHAFLMGQWTRAVWLAARSKDVDYLSRFEVRRGAHSLIQDEPDEEIRGYLREMRTALKQGEVEVVVDHVEEIAMDYRAEFQELKDFEF